MEKYALQRIIVKKFIVYVKITLCNDSATEESTILEESRNKEIIYNNIIVCNFFKN